MECGDREFEGVTRSELVFDNGLTAHSPAGLPYRIRSGHKLRRRERSCAPSRDVRPVLPSTRDVIDDRHMNALFDQEAKLFLPDEGQKSARKTLYLDNNRHLVNV